MAKKEQSKQPQTPDEKIARLTARAEKIKKKLTASEAKLAKITPNYEKCKKAVDSLRQAHEFALGKIERVKARAAKAKEKTKA